MKTFRKSIVESIFFSSFYCWWIKTSEILFEYLRSKKAYGFLLSSSIFKQHWGNRFQLIGNAFEIRRKTRIKRLLPENICRKRAYFIHYFSLTVALIACFCLVRIFFPLYRNPSVSIWTKKDKTLHSTCSWTFQKPNIFSLFQPFCSYHIWMYIF